MYDPTYDLLKSNWSPFEPVEWLLPLLTKYSGFRKKLNEISEDVYSWANNSDVLFIADFPGLYLENFIGDELDNVTLTVLEGEIVYEVEDKSSHQSLGLTLKKDESIIVEVGYFHKVHTVGTTPSCYMYTYHTTGNISEPEESARQNHIIYSPFPLLENTPERIRSFLRMWKHIGNSAFNILFGRGYDMKSQKNIE